jgi:hemerythrin
MGIEWRESLAIGVAEIDNQHKELLARFDNLLKACETGKGMIELKQVLLFLNEYIIKHFSDEEAMQKLRNYPGYESHKKEHDHFVERIKALQGEVDREGIAIHHVMETNNLLLKWLIHHISTVDVELGKFLKNQ